MRINFKSPRYMLPLIILPFLCLFFYIYQSSLGKDDPVSKEGEDPLQSTISGVSEEVKKRALADKLEAYRRQYSGGDGYTAIGQILDEQAGKQQLEGLYNQQEKRMLDSIEKALAGRDDTGATSTGRDHEQEDHALAEALSSLGRGPDPPNSSQESPDPMVLFRKQMTLIDSMSKANDPQYQAELLRERRQEEAKRKAENIIVLHVAKARSPSAAFNTILPENEAPLIQAIVDEHVTGYAGSRLRIRLLDDIIVGKNLIHKGSYLYAEISGFTGQRVMLTISSIMQKGEILPVHLEVYDNDGLQGLYVPASAFREFSQELGNSAGQGITLQQQAENNSQLVMSVLQRMFQSTTTAVTKQIRKNKAKIKYNTLVYLIDTRELRNNQHIY